MNYEILVPVLQLDLVRIYQIDDGCRLACARWTVEEKVREIRGFNNVG
jgi:hypothetical protein